jgi:hypothetical protein
MSEENVKPPKGTMCCEDVWQGYSRYACANKANVLREGKAYCGVHDPERRKGREAVRLARSRWEGTLRTLHQQKRAFYTDIANEAIGAREDLGRLAALSVEESPAVGHRGSNSFRQGPN